MKTQLKSIVAVFAIITSLCTNAQNYCDSNPVDIHGKLSVAGNKIVDESGATVSFAGNSFFWSNNGWGGEDYYTADVVSWLKDDWGSTIVRAAMGVEDSGGYLSDSSNKDKVKTVVDAAISEGLYVIIDWHSHHAENYTSQAVEFFQEMATLYGNHPNVIYEVYNEPIYSSWSGDIKPYAETVIAAIRAIDSDNLIIVGTPTWSQDVDIASNDPITSSTNIAYTLHFYAGTHFDSLRAKAQTALNNGIALMVTEWGSVNANGDGGVNYSSTEAWMTFLKENEISHLNWSVNDKAEGASILNSGASSNGGWSDSNLTESGTYIKSIIQSWTQYCEGGGIVNPPTPPTVTYTEIPALIEAEDYDSQSGTQLENTEDNGGGDNVGWIDTGDFISYNIDVPNSGNYTIDFRLASETNGASFDIYTDDTFIGSFSSEATGGWQTWETVSTTVSLDAGKQTIKLVASSIGWNINWLEFSEGDDVIVPPTPTTEYIAIPALIQAEDFDSQSGTQLENSEDNGGGDNVGWIDTGDYLTYNINVPNSGTYTIDFRVASRSNGTSFDIYSGNSVIGNISSSATGGWQTWETVSTSVTLDEGEQELNLVATGNGWNINWLEFKNGDEVENYLTVSSLSDFDSNTSSQSVSVSSNVDWVVSENSSWITIISMSNSFDVSVSENTSTIDRTATIIISGGGISRSINVFQAGKEDNTSNNCGDIQTWNASTIYALAGTKVVYNGIIYENKWYTKNQNPESFSTHSWDLWTVIGPCTSAKSLGKSTINEGLIKIYQDATNTLVIFVDDTDSYTNALIFNLQGRMIVNKALTNSRSEIPLEKFEDGIYFVKLLGKKSYSQSILKK